MTTLNAELYDALIDAGAADDKARQAAASVAGQEQLSAKADLAVLDQIATKADLAALEGKLQAQITAQEVRLVKWGVGLAIAVVGTLKLIL